MDPLDAITSIDGRYRPAAEPLAAFFSEAALIRYRVRVEVQYLIALSAAGLGLRPFTDAETELLRGIAAAPDAASVKRIETEGAEGVPATNHDVKAVEYFLKAKLQGTSLADAREWIHFGLTSEDVNNLSYALMLSDALDKVVAPTIREVVACIDGLAKTHAAVPMLARTHGQPASPTTVGKEFKVFAARIERRLVELASIRIQAKLNGASGNWNAHLVAYPQFDWTGFSRTFIESFNAGRTYQLEANPFTTQIESHDSYVAVCDAVRRINAILLGLSQDVWRYVSDGWMIQAPKPGEVGSSTMPHKVNPIDFENAEGNLGIANALFEFFARKLPVSRLQRDLSDSTVERSFGAAFAHSLIAYRSLQKGFGKVAVDEAKVRADLRAHPEVIAEAIQTILRREGAAMPYEELKKLTRGRQVTVADFAAFIDGLAVTDAVKAELKAVAPENYVGLAERLARS